MAPEHSVDAVAAFLSRWLVSTGLRPVEAALWSARWRWLPLQVLLFAALFFGIPAAVRPHWPALVASAPSVAAFYALAAVGVNAGVTITCNLLLLPVYVFDLAPRAWRNSSKPWPWEGSPSRRAAFFALIARSLAVVCFNIVVLGGSSTYYVVAPIAARVGAFSTSAAAWPSALELGASLAVSAVVEDAMFYWTHRALHTRMLYAAVHKWHHNYETVVGLSSEHAHPLEFVAGNLIPVIAGPLLLRAHAFTLFIWVGLRVLISIDEHCGFTFPFSPVRLLPWGASAEGHDYHHSANTGMYASQFVFWDRLCGTDKTHIEHLERKAAAAAATVEAVATVAVVAAPKGAHSAVARAPSRARSSSSRGSAARTSVVRAR